MRSESQFCTIPLRNVGSGLGLGGDTGCCTGLVGAGRDLLDGDWVGVFSLTNSGALVMFLTDRSTSCTSIQKHVGLIP